MVDRKQVGAVAGRRIPHRLGDRLLLLVVMLDEGRIQHLDDRYVEAVEPEHRLVGVVAVVVPGHVGRDDEVARMHGRALAVDAGMRALAFQDEAQRRLRMAVRARYLVRHDELHAGIERGGDLGLPAQAGIFQDQHAALGFLGCDQAARLQHGRADVVEPPQCRQAAAFRLGCDEAAQDRPQRRHVLLVDAGVERLALGRLCGGVVHAVRPQVSSPRTLGR